jgi:hypothetical protein
MTLIRCALLAVSFCLLVGCSSRSKATATGRFLVLQDVNDLLHAAAGATGRLPAGLADLDRHKGMFPRGYEAVQSGAVVVLWGASIQGEGDIGKNEVVVAYEKGVPTDGGHVLLSAGTVKKMTASDFNAAPKGGVK